MTVLLLHVNNTFIVKLIFFFLVFLIIKLHVGCMLSDFFNYDKYYSMLLFARSLISICMIPDFDFCKL